MIDWAKHGIAGFQFVDAGNGRTTTQPILTKAALEQMKLEHSGKLAVEALRQCLDRAANR